MSEAQGRTAAQQPVIWRKKLLDWLARREYAAAEAASRLRRAGCPEDTAQHLVAECCEQQLIDDRRCAQLRAESLLKRGYGSDNLRQDLQQKGIAEDLVEETLAGQDWRERARQSLSRRFGSRSPNPLAAVRYLAGKGFPGDLAASVVGLDGDS